VTINLNELEDYFDKVKYKNMCGSGYPTYPNF